MLSVSGCSGPEEVIMGIYAGETSTLVLVKIGR